MTPRWKTCHDLIDWWNSHDGLSGLHLLLFLATHMTWIALLPTRNFKSWFNIDEDSYSLKNLFFLTTCRLVECTVFWLCFWHSWSVYLWNEKKRLRGESSKQCQREYVPRVSWVMILLVHDPTAQFSISLCLLTSAWAFYIEWMLRLPQSWSNFVPVVCRVKE